MAILIDKPLWWHRGERWSHLVSDVSYDELHAFVALLTRHAAKATFTPNDTFAVSAGGSGYVLQRINGSVFAGLEADFGALDFSRVNLDQSVSSTKVRRSVLFVPPSMPVMNLLLRMQSTRKHMALVVDEYGGVTGVISLEDIIEEIVGDIQDEFDDEDLIFSKLDDFTYIFEGKTTLKDFYRVTKIKNEEDFESQKGESETIAGFVLEIAGSFPKRGEIVSYMDYQFLVESLDKKRLKQIKVTLPREK